LIVTTQKQDPKVRGTPAMAELRAMIEIVENQMVH
jgi:hypothetical protein